MVFFFHSVYYFCFFVRYFNLIFLYGLVIALFDKHCHVSTVFKLHITTAIYLFVPLSYLESRNPRFDCRLDGMSQTLCNYLFSEIGIFLARDNDKILLKFLLILYVLHEKIGQNSISEFVIAGSFCFSNKSDQALYRL